MTLLNTRGQILTPSARRFIYHDAQSLVGKPLAGNGECVALVQKYLPEIGHTTTWKAGPITIMWEFLAGWTAAV